MTSAAFGNNNAIPSGFTCDGWRVSLGIHMAGRDLTPKTFHDCIVRVSTLGEGTPAAASRRVRGSYGRKGGLPGSVDYFGQDDVVQVWWEAEARGPDELAGIIGKGLYRCVDGAKRYRFDHYLKAEPKWFDPTAPSPALTSRRSPREQPTTELSVRGLPLGRGLMTQRE